MAETNQFNIEVGVDTKDSISKLKELGSTLEGVASSVKGSTSSMSSSFTAMSAKLGSSLKSVGSTMSVGLTAPLALLGTALFNSAAQMEQISVSFEVFTGSAEVAKNMLTQLKDQALKSPMQFQDIAKGAQTLLGYGLTAEQVIPITRMLGDISGGNADKFSRLSLAFGQVNAAGRLMGQEVRQMINAGFNPLQSISEKTGESMASLSKRMKDGQISVQEVADAFKYATSEGGRFFGNADKQSQTLQGQLNKLQESVSFALAEIGTSLANNAGVKQFFESLTSTVTKVKDAFLSLSPQTQSLILKLALIVATVGPVLVIFGSLLSSIASIATAVGVLSAAFVGLNIATGGILIGLGLFVVAMVKIAQNAREAADSIDYMKKRAEATNDVWTGPNSITESVVYLKNQLKELEENYSVWDSENKYILENAFEMKQLSRMYNSNPTLGNVYENAFQTIRNKLSKNLHAKLISINTAISAAETSIMANLVPIDDKYLTVTKNNNENSKTTKNKKIDSMKKIFISHSNKDKLIVNLFVDLLISIGIKHTELFYSSHPAYGVDLGEEMFPRLKKELNEEIYVIFILSSNFYSSKICLCELGATWVKTNKHVNVLIPPFSFKEVEGVLPITLGMEINNNLELTRLKEDIEKNFEIANPIPLVSWEEKKAKFLIEINELISKIDISKVV
jgi:tape measure domain-containing protein